MSTCIRIWARGLYQNIMTCSKSKCAESGTCKQMQIWCSCNGNLQRQWGPHLYANPLPPEKLSCTQCEPEMEGRIYLTECNVNSQLQLRLRGCLQINLLIIFRGNELWECSEELKTDKIVEGEERNKILKHQGKIWRRGDNRRSAGVKRIFKKCWVKTDGQKKKKKWRRKGETERRNERMVNGRERKSRAFFSLLSLVFCKSSSGR